MIDKTISFLENSITKNNNKNRLKHTSTLFLYYTISNVEI